MLIFLNKTFSHFEILDRTYFRYKVFYNATYYSTISGKVITKVVANYVRV